jgi:ABC-2 type transport system ATP-binding protein
MRVGPPASEAMAVVATGLTKRFGSFTAVDGISFSVRRGEIFGFLGPNGSGKTTTIRMILGLLEPTAGSIEVLGQPASRDSMAVRRRLGYMSQRFSLYPELTVAENLRFFGRAYGVTGDHFAARKADVLKMAGLVGHEDQVTETLSGGWKQRLALGAAMLHEPEILFLDEPTAGVDPLSRRAFWDLLYEQAANGVTIFVTTHYMDEAEHCHRLAFIYQGRIIAQGTPPQVRAGESGVAVLEVDCADPEGAVTVLSAAAAEGTLAAREVTLYGSLVHVATAQPDLAAGVVSGALAAASIELHSLARVEPSLEDVFVSLVRAQRRTALGAA